MGIICSFIEIQSLGSTDAHLSVAEIGEMECLLPPVSEREKIVAHLQDHIGELDKLMTKVVDHTHIPHERRTALISAAVTGKVDVR